MKASTKVLQRAFMILVFISGTLGLGLQSVIAKPTLQTTNLALNKPVTCSPTPQYPCAQAVDGNTGTRWASVQGIDPQWIYVDLGATTTISSVILRWEAAYAASFQLQTSTDAATWTNIYTTTTGTGGVQTLNLTGSGRYVRMNGTVRGTQYGYSLWEFEIYGTSGPTNTPTLSNAPAPPTLTRTNTPAAVTLTPTRTSTATSTVAAGCGTTNIALSKTATASSVLGGNTAPMAVDGATNTRWESVHGVDPQWIQIDLGATQSICHVKLTWEPAYATAYQIQVSDDATAWTSIYSTTTGNGATDDLTGLSGSGRYVRMYGTTRATTYGYSLWEFEVYAGAGGPTNTPTRTNTPPGPTNTPTLTATRTNTPLGLTNTPSLTPTTGSGCSSTNIPINRPATASSVAGANTAAMAVDTFSGTRWESAAADPQWIQLDFGTTPTFCRVVVSRGVAAASAFQIQTSPDAVNWTPIYTTTTGTGGLQDLSVSGSGRYLRMYGTLRTTTYGYSLWEFEAYGSGGTTLPTITPIPTIQSGLVDFGPNVVIFDPSMSSATIQNRLDLVFDRQETNQFGDLRDALLFKPGAYSVNANIGFNTQISGLGFSPDDVTINGSVTSDAQWFGGNATQNFWRIAENMKVVPTGGTNIWAVSQAAPFRRMHVQGALQLDGSSHGWSSGGFLADTKVDGQVSSGSQQQYISRNDQFCSWTGSNWNMVFVGVSGRAAQTFPNPAHTVVGHAPSIREKPFLYIDTGGNYFVFVPALRSNASGTSWFGQTPAGTSLPISQFFIVKPGASATDINNALVAGKDLLITPGVYHLDQAINITRANTVVLGMGLATLINDNGVVAMKVAEVGRVKHAGILFDAGTTNASTLLEVGPARSSASHSANPTSIHDVFARVGGAVAGKAMGAVTVNNSNVIIHHPWLWRADHGAGIGWTVNTADNGLVVNGANVTIYGLFVEHFQQYNVLWNGNGGRPYFFQNELPHDPPHQAAHLNGPTPG